MSHTWKLEENSEYKGLETMINKWSRESEKENVKMNENKTNVMTNSRKNTINLNGKLF